jgi:hypothetical protein
MRREGRVESLATQRTHAGSASAPLRDRRDAVERLEEKAASGRGPPRATAPHGRGQWRHRCCSATDAGAVRAPLVLRQTPWMSSGATALRAAPLHLPSKAAVVVDVRCADEPSAADDGVYLDLYEPAGIEEPLDDDEARGRPDPAEGLAVHLRDSVTVGRIHEEHTRSHYVTKRRAGLAKGLRR